MNLCANTWLWHVATRSMLMLGPNVLRFGRQRIPLGISLLRGYER